MKSQISYFKSQIGFTLIELAIAMTLMALIAVTLYGAFYLGQRAVVKSQSRSEESQRLRSAGELLAGYIRSAYPYRLAREGSSIFFSGQGDRLTFVSALSSGMGGRGMSEITISWDGEGDGTGSLILEEKMPVRVGGQGEGGGYRNSLVLGQEVQKLRIEYLDPQSQGEEERWVDQWEGGERKALPRAVRLNYRGEKGEEVRWSFPIMMSVLAP